MSSLWAGGEKKKAQQLHFLNQVMGWNLFSSAVLQKQDQHKQANSEKDTSRWSEKLCEMIGDLSSSSPLPDRKQEHGAESLLPNRMFLF